MAFGGVWLAIFIAVLGVSVRIAIMLVRKKVKKLTLTESRAKFKNHVVLLVSLFIIFLVATPVLAASYQYDGLGRLTTVTYDSGQTITYSYDAAGNITSVNSSVTVSSVVVKTAPTKVTYTAGNFLDLTGLVVTLTKSDTTTLDVAFADFAANGISTVKANGAALVPADTAVVITVNGKTASQAITVNAAGTTKILQSIAITTPANKLSYTVGDTLDISGLAVTGTYSDGSIKAESITAANITGFNSAVTATDQVLTITVSSKTVTYKVQIVATPVSTSIAPNIIIYQDANGKYVSVNYLNALSNTSMKTALISALSGAELANLPIYVTADNGKSINYLAAINKSENYATAINDSAVAISTAPVPTEQMNADGSVTSL